MTCYITVAMQTYTALLKLAAVGLAVNTYELRTGSASTCPGYTTLAELAQQIDGAQEAHVFVTDAHGEAFWCCFSGGVIVDWCVDICQVLDL